MPTKSRFLKTIQDKEKKLLPIWLMRQAGRYLPEYREVRAKSDGFLSLCYNPDQATEVTLQPIRRFGFDASIIFSDILVIPHALGIDVTFKEKEGPIVQKITSEKELSTIKSVLQKDHLAPVYEAISNVRAKLPSETALIGFAGNPWTLATYVIEGGSSKHFSHVKSLAFAQTPFFSQLMDILSDAVIEHLSEQIQAGVDAVQLFDSWAGALPSDMFEQWVIKPTQKIVSEIKKRHPSTPIIGFPKGASFMYPAFTTQTGVDVTGLDSTVPLDWASESFDKNHVLQGNLDPSVLLSSKAVIEKQVQSIIESFNDRPFIFNLGHGILPNTPIENVEFLIDKVRKYRHD